MKTTPQGMNSQEELKKADEFAVNEHMRSLGFKWDDTRETWYNADNVWMYQKAAINLSTRIEAEASRRAKDAEELGAYMAASSILTEMAPLMVHRLERGFPEMTGEVIGNVYEQVKKEMKPYQRKRQSLKEKKESE